MSIKNIKKSGWPQAPGAASGWHPRASRFVVTISIYRCWDEKLGIGDGSAYQRGGGGVHI